MVSAVDAVVVVHHVQVLSSDGLEGGMLELKSMERCLRAWKARIVALWHWRSQEMLAEA